MAKKIKDENGNVYKMKKPFYKKVWFWLLTLVVIGAIGSSLGSKENGGEKVSTDKTEAGNSKETSKSKEKEFYKIGDTVKVGDASYTLNSVELTDERNEFDETNPAYVVKVQYTMENNSDKDLPVGMDLSIYNSDDTQAQSYPNDNTMGSLAPGKKIESTQHFGLNANGEIELQFSPMVSFEKTADFKATI